jgi:guanosine-3',5'-bis(diphosphate) 3'-pyrophosphohydrolase
MKSIVLITRAMEFAAHKHTDQKRKGKRAEPYVNHLVEVARLLAEATSGDDPALVTAGLLHDTLEDTYTTFEELEREFGAEIAALVQEVTDDKTLLKAERKRLQIETAGKKSPRARLIKIADKTSNLRSILASPPADWSTQRKREYFDWAAAVVARCRGINAQLEEVFDRAYAEGIAVFTINAA